MDARREPEVVVEFTIDICQAPGDRPRMPRNGKGKPDGVSRRGIRILTKNQYFDIGQRLLESAEKVAG